MKKCPYCGEEINEAAVKCRYCGEFIGEGAAPKRPAYAEEPRRSEQPEQNPTTIFVLGLLSLLIGCIGGILGIFAWVMGSKFKKGVKEGRYPDNGLATAGYVMGIIGTFVNILIVPIIMAIAVPTLLESREAAWQCAAVAACRATSSSMETYSIKNGTYFVAAAAITEDANELLTVGDAIEMSVGAAKNYDFSYTGSASAWSLSAKYKNDTLYSFFIDESGVLRYEKGTADENSAPYSP